MICTAIWTRRYELCLGLSVLGNHMNYYGIEDSTKPYIILKKYHSILMSSIVVESVAFLASLTDSLVAGNIVDADAFAAVGLLMPFFFLSSFLAAVINAGTLLNYNNQAGAFRQRRAHEYFSQGIYLSVMAGLVFFVVMLFCKGMIFKGLSVPSGMEQYLSDYYNIIVFYFLIYPTSCLLGNIVIADGGEKLSLAVNLIQIIVNILLSLILSHRMGVKGIALATVISPMLPILLLLPWFFSGRNTLRLLLYMSPGDCLDITRRGSVRASTLVLMAVATYILNAYVSASFDSQVLQILILQEKIISLSSVFLGLSMAVQPLIATLKGEKNTKAARILIRRASLVMLFSGGLITVSLMLFAGPFVRAFGISGRAQVLSGIFAVRITAATLICPALLVFFFYYYYLIDHYRLALVICFIKDLLSTVGLTILLAMLFKKPEAIWLGLAFAPVLSLMVCSAIVWFHYGRKLFPWLIPGDRDKRIFIHSFMLDEKQSVALSEKTAYILKKEGYPQRLQNLAAFYVEEMLMLVREKNGSSPVLVECTLILNEEDVRMILRDSGQIFNLAEEDALPSSFRQYVVANMISVLESKAYLVNTGYNRHEFVFSNRLINSRK